MWSAIALQSRINSDNGLNVKSRLVGSTPVDIENAVVPVLLGVADHLPSLGGLVQDLLGLEPGDVTGWDVSSSQVGLLLFWVD